MSIRSVENHQLLVEKLRARRSQLASRLGRMSVDRRRPGDRDSGEQAVERENDEVLDRLDATERAELDSIDRAIRRIDAGSFGVCDRCGDDIDPLRLEAVPSTAFCVACAAANESASRR